MGLPETPPLSLSKSQIGANEVRRVLDRSRIIVANNGNWARGSLSKLQLDRAALSLDGAIESDLAPTGFSDFFSLPGMVLPSGSRFCLRGPRYLASIYPGYDVRLKLRTYREDFTRGYEALSDLSRVIAFPSEAVAVADYVKNAAVTMLNAFVQREKIGDFGRRDPQYALRRSELVYLASGACEMFYSLLLGDASRFHLSHLRIAHLLTSLADAARYVERAYSEGTFSSRFLVRPEAAHPVVILSSALLTAEKVKADTVVGLPSGATELAFAHAFAQHRTYTSRPVVLLLPLSLHSSKQQFDGISQTTLDPHANFVLESAVFMNGRTVLVVDDNSSTGQTVETARALLQSLDPGPEAIHVSIAEADTIRSEIDLDNADRPRVSSPDAYRYSVGVLPVSRRLRPKVYLVELKERSRLRFHLRRMRNSELGSYLLRVKYDALIAAVENSSDNASLSDMPNAIVDFRHTFLSNFYIAPVVFEGRVFPSVEHAYQRAKFLPADLLEVHEDHRFEVDQILRMRGREPTKGSLVEFFEDSTISAGHVKVVADFLRRRDYARTDWDDIKLDLMVDLLVQKFQQRQLMDALLATGEKTLIEGNTWSDTYWGVSDGRGKNLLGHLLMIIRRDERDRRLVLSAA